MTVQPIASPSVSKAISAKTSGRRFPATCAGAHILVPHPLPSGNYTCRCHRVPTCPCVLSHSTLWSQGPLILVSEMCPRSPSWHGKPPEFSGWHWTDTIHVDDRARPPQALLSPTSGYTSSINQLTYCQLQQWVYLNFITNFEKYFLKMIHSRYLISICWMNT